MKKILPITLLSIGVAAVAGAIVYKVVTTKKEETVEINSSKKDAEDIKETSEVEETAKEENPDEIPAVYDVFPPEELEKMEETKKETIE